MPWSGNAWFLGWGKKHDAASWMECKNFSFRPWSDGGLGSREVVEIWLGYRECVREKAARPCTSRPRFYRVSLVRVYLLVQDVA